MPKTAYTLLTLAIAAVWLVNGLWCKVLGGVPRHEQIVAAILGAEYAPVLTVLIGLAEVVMAVWIQSAWQRRWSSGLQIATVLSMNVLEFLLVPELLLWGRFNALFAVLFVVVVYYHGYVWPQTVK